MLIYYILQNQAGRVYTVQPVDLTVLTKNRINWAKKIHFNYCLDTNKMNEEDDDGKVTDVIALSAFPHER